MTNRRIIQGDHARAALTRGVDVMTAALFPTLGPTGGAIVVARDAHDARAPEYLDSAALIARRTTGFAEPFVDMGAMIARHAVWRVFESVGDGTATTAVLTRALVHEGTRYLAAGGNAADVRRGLTTALAVARMALHAQARPVDTPVEIAATVAGTVRDARIAAMIGEIADAVGVDGAITVEESHTATTTYEYTEGVRWNEGFVSPAFATESDTTARVTQPRVFITDHRLTDTAQLLPAVEACVAAGDRSLIVIAPEVSGGALALLLINRERGTLSSALAVKAPPAGAQRSDVLEDLAALTGARCMLLARYERPESVTTDDLGRAHAAWATRTAFGIIGGAGAWDAVGARIAALQAALSDEGNEHERAIMRERIGKLSGPAAIIRVGGATASARADVKLRVEAAVAAARLALRDGVVPGGGAAWLACIPMVEAAAVALGGGDEAVGVRILAGALRAPMRAIAANAGHDAGIIVHQAATHGEGETFDVVQGVWVDAWEAGIYDPLAVALAALETSVSAAAMILTTDVLVRRRTPPVEMTP